MRVKINQKMINIPPYISTSWDNVSHLQMDEVTGHLVVITVKGDKIIIPHLPPELMERIFTAHAEYVETASSTKEGPHLPEGLGIFNLGMGPGSLGLGPEGLQSLQMLQHDPSQSDAPDLPPAMIDKILSVTKGLGMEKLLAQMGESEPHCNCPFCQINRAILDGEVETAEESTPDIDNSLPEANLSEDPELSFRKWDIVQVSTNLYDVTDPFDKSLHYRVSLGNPQSTDRTKEIGCTCGQPNCEHLKAVLHSHV